MNIKKNYIPSNRSSVDSFYVMDVLAKAKEMENIGKEIFHFELGEPSPSTPKKITDEAKRLIDLDLPGYTPSNGIHELRRKIAQYYLKKNISINSDQVFITTGSSGAFLLSFLTCFDAGDKVVIFNPSYPAYRNILKSLNLEVVEIESSPDNDFNIDLTKIKLQKNVRGLIVSSPNNPNGQIFSKKELKFIYSFCEENNIVLISDEIYHGIGKKNNFISMQTFGEKCLIINSFSKFFCMPGWRLGWIVVPNSFIENFLKLSQNLFISTNNIAQFSAIKAFECIDEFEKNNKMYNENRNYVYKKLQLTKWNKFSMSEGGFYTYINLSEFESDSVKIVRKILDETGVALTSGVDFDKDNGNSAVRLSFSGNKINVKNGIDKLVEWINNNY